MNYDGHLITQTRELLETDKYFKREKHAKRGRGGGVGEYLEQCIQMFRQMKSSWMIQALKT